MCACRLGYNVTFVVTESGSGQASAEQLTSMPSVRRHTHTWARLRAPFSWSDSVGNVAASGTPYSWTNLLNMAIRSRSRMMRIASIFGT